MLEYYCVSIPAHHKSAEQNEDAYLCRVHDDGALIVAVADGVSSSGGGRVAATEVLKIVEAAYNTTRSHGRLLFKAFRDGLHASQVSITSGERPQSTLTVALFSPILSDGSVAVSFFAIGDTGILLAQDKRLDESYPKTFVCYRIFGRPQPSMDSRLYAYVDLVSGEISGRVIFGEFDLHAGDICIVHSDGVRDDYIQRTTNREHRLLWDIKERGTKKALKTFVKYIGSDVGDDATIVAIRVLAEITSNPNAGVQTGNDSEAVADSEASPSRLQPHTKGGIISSESASPTSESLPAADSKKPLSEAPDQVNNISNDGQAER
jgi:serine/threonine protein phosphatase PrpC